VKARPFQAGKYNCESNSYCSAVSLRWESLKSDPEFAGANSLHPASLLPLPPVLEGGREVPLKTTLLPLKASGCCTPWEGIHASSSGTP
jgi:hypothetical protein